MENCDVAVYVAESQGIAGATEVAATGGTTDIEDIDKNEVFLGQNFPNPSQTSSIVFLNGISIDMKLQVLDYTGKLISTQNIQREATSVEINTSDLAAGMYIYQLTTQSGAVIASKTMQVVR